MRICAKCRFRSVPDYEAGPHCLACKDDRPSILLIIAVAAVGCAVWGLIILGVTKYAF